MRLCEVDIMCWKSFVIVKNRLTIEHAIRIWLRLEVAETIESASTRKILTESNARSPIGDRVRRVVDMARDTPTILITHYFTIYKNTSAYRVELAQRVLNENEGINRIAVRGVKAWIISVHTTHRQRDTLKLN